MTTNDIGAPAAFHLVGIGASAGGLNALEQFFDNMPSDTGMAFIVIQHLSPDFKSLMDDLLSRHTTMAIHRVADGIRIEPNSIYLSPPRHQMTLAGGCLQLTEKPINQHLELPIDVFFKSLSQGAGQLAVAVVLSGTGSDGSRGIQAIHSAGGMVMVQSPESAQFDGMPRSAVDTGAWHFQMPPDRMARTLIDYVKNPAAVLQRAAQALDVDEDEGEYAEVFAILRRDFNLDFSKYKSSTVGRRIGRRMALRQLTTIADYAAVLAGDRHESDHLYRDLLIGVTEFYRDPEAFDFLDQRVLPQLFLNHPASEDMRVWSAGCATGEEPYSLAILLAEHAERTGFSGKITVFATDAHRSSLDTAAAGVYDAERLAKLSPGRIERFFKRETDGSFRVLPELRKLVVFAPHNLVNDPPFTKLDLVSCRNLLIYFQPPVQEKVLSLFHFALRIDGMLFLGSSEGLGTLSPEFETLEARHKVFKKIRDAKLPVAISGYTHRDSQSPRPDLALTKNVSLDRQLLNDYDYVLKRHSPPGALIDENRRVIHYFGEIGAFLKPQEGRVEYDFHQLVNEDVHVPLTTAFQRAVKSRERVVASNIRVSRDGAPLLIDLVVEPIFYSKERSFHYHVYFSEIREQCPQPLEQRQGAAAGVFDAGDQYKQFLTDLQNDLQTSRENLQATIEELQTSNEELQATNEELLASNEELQSTNEELHSVNEELYTVNSEFERKNNELKQLNLDHENLLASTEVGTVFLDRNRRIRKFNPAISAFFKLLPQDLGRPIDHIAYQLPRQELLLSAIREVLEEGSSREMEQRADDGRCVLIRVLPFRTGPSRADGVVVTFTEITRIKDAEMQVRILNEELQQIVEQRTRELGQEVALHGKSREDLKVFQSRYRALYDTMSELSVLHELVFDPSGAAVDYRILDCNAAFSTITGVPREKAVGALASNLYGTGAPPYLEIYRDVALGAKPTTFEAYFEPMDRYFSIMAFPVGANGFATVATDISERKKTDAMLREISSKLAAKTGDEYFRGSTEFIARHLGLDYVLIGELLPGGEAVFTVSVYGNGAHQENFQYGLRNTPCEQVMGRGVYTLARGVRETFPQDRLLRDMGVESYVGVPLFSSAGRPLGVIVGLGRKALTEEQSEKAAALLGIMGGRAAAELERKKAEESLQKSEALLSTVVSGVDAGILLIDRDGNILKSNESVSRILGQPESSLSLDALLGDGGRKQLDGMLNGEADSARFDLRIPRPDGSASWAEVGFSAIRSEQGRTESIAGIISDVTERKRHERLTKAHEFRMRTLLSFTELSEITESDLFDRALEAAIAQTGSAIGYIYFYDEDSRRFIVHAWSKEVMNACAIREPATEYDLDKTGIWGEAVRQRKSIVVNDFSAPDPLKKGYPEGHVPLSRFLTVPVFESSRIVAVVGVANKTEPYDTIDEAQLILLMNSIWEMIQRKRAEAELAGGQRALQELNMALEQRVSMEVDKNREKDRLMILHDRQAAMGEMIGNIAHQWRQPINAVGAILQDIRSASQHNELDDAYLAASVDEGVGILKHMSRTIDDFRNFFRPDKEKERFDAGDRVEKTVELVRAGFANNGIELDVQREAAVFIEGYPNEYAQTLINILNNAKAVLTERKVRQGRVSIRVGSEGNRSVVTVGDNGGGIDPAIIDRIFEPYFSTKSEGDGTGIGLHMAKTIIEKNMRGRLSVRNAGGGAEFRIEV